MDDGHAVQGAAAGGGSAGGKLRLAFYGRVSTEDNQDLESSRNWQLSLARQFVAPHGGEVVA